MKVRLSTISQISNYLINNLDGRVENDRSKDRADRKIERFNRDAISPF